MPKTYLTKQDQLNSRLARWVYGELKVRQMSQAQLAREMQISQQALSMKLRIARFTFDDLCTFIRVFEPSEDEIERLVTIK
jgi:predicted XRE-type DNA-binding protein